MPASREGRRPGKADDPVLVDGAVEADIRGFDQLYVYCQVAKVLADPPPIQPVAEFR
jgi:hypothetical protein